MTLDSGSATDDSKDDYTLGVSDVMRLVGITTRYGVYLRDADLMPRVSISKTSGRKTRVYSRSLVEAFARRRERIAVARHGVDE